MNTAAVTTDLGTRAAGEKYTDRSHAWPECVLRDFHWRATHLMTVYGKRIVQAFYGRPCSKAYFYGGSTGGRQGITEALRFPGDYDGIVSFLPAVMGAVNEVAIWHLWRQTHDDEGRALFTKEDFAAIAAAAIEFRSKSDPKPYAGSVIADGRFTEAEIDGFIKLAVKNRPALAAGDRPARLKALYMPLVHDGKCYFTGFTPGTDHGANFHWGSLISMPHFLAGKGFVQSVWKKVGFKEVDMYLAELSPEFNACSLELDAFVKRGGKIIMTTGWEDQTVPPGPIVEYYERLCRKYGGVGKVSEFMRLFCIPGCAHGGSKGRIITGGVPSGRVMKQQLVDWREKGIPPEKLVLNWRARKMQLPIAPYPQLYVQDDAKGWKLQEARRSVPCIDASCLKTDLKNLKERND
jgi:feruloyl esterase